MRGNILIYDQNETRMHELARELTSKGHIAHMASDIIRFDALLAEREFDVVLVAAGPGECLQVLDEVKNQQPKTQVILSAAEPNVEGAVAAIKGGAFHYMAYPLTTEKMELLTQKALEQRVQAMELEELRNMLRETQGPRFIGQSPAMQELRKTIRRVATLDCTVLINGETGTGKELAAKVLHSMSTRADKKFLAVNCGALSDELLTNELFGHEPGAYTGASERKKGLFEAASGGTILLDEIGDTSSAMQVQLLRVLQERNVMRVGATEEIPVNVRILAATNRDLHSEVARGSFREDLYYRLNVFTLHMPPLRDRRDDIPLFCRYFIDKFAQQFNKPVERVSEEAMTLFMNYPFPGNVRELENALERAVVLCDGPEILAAHLPRRMQSGPAVTCSVVSRDSMPTLEQVEAEYIREVMSHTEGNKTEAARILGINRSSLWRKLKSLRLDG